MKKIIYYALLMLFFNSTNAAIKLPALVGDNMVLQRSKPLKIWGTADPDEKIKVSFLNKEYHSTANSEGQWVIKLPSLKAGGPYNMVLKGSNEIILKNILIGDVWLCSGQSNMFFKVREANNAEAEIAKANFPLIHFFRVPTTVSAKIENNVSGNWKNCDSETVKESSAVAYYFAKSLQSRIKVPIGLVQSSFGATPIEGWISTEGIKDDPQFGELAKMISTTPNEVIDKMFSIKFNNWMDSLVRLDSGYTNGTFAWSKNHHPEWPEMILPGYIENRDPVMKGRDGIIWFSKTIQLTAEDLKDECIFNMGPVIDDDLVFINGIKIGATKEVKYGSRTYKVPKEIIHAGINNITIRIIDYGAVSGISGKPANFNLKTAERIVPLAGSWNYKISVNTIFKTYNHSGISQQHEPGIIYNAMIAPLTNYKFKGVIWYQGESNVERAYQYRKLFPALINDWRKQFKQADLPFLYVQLANFRAMHSEPGESVWAELREAQMLALKLPATGMVATIDIGDANNIHPANKQAVGERLANVAHTIVYGEVNLLSSGPVYDNAEFKGAKVIITFRNFGNGLVSSDTSNILMGFQIATGGNKKFKNIKASIIGKNAVEIQSTDGKPITAVRYAWADNPGPLNLINSANLPAFPFRTDSFRAITYDDRY